MNVRPISRTCAVAVLVLCAGVGGSAQSTQSNTAPADPGIVGQYVKTGLFVFSGQGGNSVLRLSGGGLILVDGKLPGSYNALIKQTKKIVKQPVRVLILTSDDEARMGTNQDFLQNGAAIIVQQNAKLSLTSLNAAADKFAAAAADKGSTQTAVRPTVPADDESPTPAPGKATPIITYDREYQIQLGGVDVQLLHFGNAHTNADTVVYFPNLKVVAVGDLFAPAPDPNYAAGGSLAGWGPVLAQVLKLDFDTVVPSAGPTVTRAQLEAFKTKIDTLVSRGSALVGKGVPEDQFMSQLKTDDLGWKLNFTPAQVEGFYAELSKSGQQLHAAELTVPGNLPK